MKTTSTTTKHFTPFDTTISFESEAEALAFRAVLNHSSRADTVCKVLEDASSEYRHKITEAGVTAVVGILYDTIVSATDRYAK